MKERKYNMPDSEMIEMSATLQSLFVDNMADFMQADSTLNQAFANEWFVQIRAAIGIDPHRIVKARQGQLTEQVHKQMNTCRTKYREIKYFAGKAFNDNKVYLAQFGTRKYGKLSRTAYKLVGFMHELQIVATRYQTELHNAGMSLNSINEISALGTALKDIANEQENYIKQKKVLTAQRIAILNTCYHSTSVVLKAAKIVYTNDPARWGMFKL